jgi:hypothetical protein
MVLHPPIETTALIGQVKTVEIHLSGNPTNQDLTTFLNVPKRSAALLLRWLQRAAQVLLV